ncbi:hypothetical protein BDQ17DRAFT_1336408 [Cyathus striatus]|nr:hypothetical protein BDQ17DRAFT_1336408 [Cyathus striatus]
MTLSLTSWNVFNLALRLVVRNSFEAAASNCGIESWESNVIAPLPIVHLHFPLCVGQLKAPPSRNNTPLEFSSRSTPPCSFPSRAFTRDISATLLRALATGEHPWATYALSLDIGDLGPEDYNFPEEAEDYSARYNTEVLEPYDSQRELIQDLLEGAVANCQRVITVVNCITNLWVVGINYESSSTLRHLNLLLYCSEDEASFLSSLVQSAQPLRITHLDVGGRDTGISTAGDTWSMLTDEEIYLQRIAHIEITQSMLKYFGSYSGLKSVKFEMKHYGNVDKELKEITFNEYLDALGNHAGSLEDLTILPPGEEGIDSEGSLFTPPNGVFVSESHTPVDRMR